MAGKIKITPEGLNLMVAVSNGNYSGGFYGKEVYFTDGFAGDMQFLFQALGNIGAFAQNRNVDKDISIVVVSNTIIENPFSLEYSEFKSSFEELFNQNNSPFKRIVFMTEDDLIIFLQNRAKNTNDDDLSDFVRKYKQSKPRKPRRPKDDNVQKALFD